VIRIFAIALPHRAGRFDRGSLDYSQKIEEQIMLERTLFGHKVDSCGKSFVVPPSGGPSP
jgi:hypothetical protein